mmetsp:Transcript_8813/g.10543  ORF Transcript_8813/g.10543 Transcript_8813/m.10543 type:complete len:265 (+) Transcript_8813:51-845(+)
MIGVGTRLVGRKSFRPVCHSLSRSQTISLTTKPAFVRNSSVRGYAVSSSEIGKPPPVDRKTKANPKKTGWKKLPARDNQSGYGKTGKSGPKQGGRGMSKRKNQEFRKQVDSLTASAAATREEWPEEEQMVEKLVCLVMKDGKKSVARKIVQEAGEIIVRKHKVDPRIVFKNAIENSGPPVQMKSKRKGAQRLHIPFPITEEKRNFTAIRFLVDEARKVKGKKMSENLAKELFDASNNEGRAVAKCQELMKVAAQNRANVFLRWG